MSNYLLTIKTVDGNTRVIHPTEAFEPFRKERGSRVNNAVALMIDTSRSTITGKKISIVSGSISNLDSPEKEVVLIKLKNEKRN